MRTEVNSAVPPQFNQLVALRSSVIGLTRAGLIPRGFFSHLPSDFSLAPAGGSFSRSNPSLSELPNLLLCIPILSQKLMFDLSR